RPVGSRLHCVRTAREPAVLRTGLLRPLSQSRSWPLASILLSGTSSLDASVYASTHLGDAAHGSPDSDSGHCFVPNDMGRIFAGGGHRGRAPLPLAASNRGILEHADVRDSFDLARPVGSFGVRPPP